MFLYTMFIYWDLLYSQPSNQYIPTLGMFFAFSMYVGRKSSS